MPTLGLWEFILDHVMASAVLASLGPGPLVPRPSGPRGLLVLRSSAPLLCSYGMNDKRAAGPSCIAFSSRSQ